MNNPDIRFYPNGRIRIDNKTLLLSENTMVNGISPEAMAINALALHVKELYETIMVLENRLRSIDTRFGA